MQEDNAVLMCEHIAIGNPIGASELCEKYGYAVDETNAEQISQTLNGIIQDNPNKQIFKEVCNIHPDKDLILEFCQPKDKKVRMNYSGNGDCGCKENAMQTNYRGYQMWGYTPNRFDAIGSGSDKSSTFSNIMASQTNTILIFGVVLIAGAIFLKNKN
jgi:hypothetical protein